MERNELNERELNAVAGGGSAAGAKYSLESVLYEKDGRRKRFKIHESFLQDGAIIYRGTMQIYSLVPPGSGGALPLPMTKPQYHWFDYGTLSYSETQLDAGWEPGLE